MTVKAAVWLRRQTAGRKDILDDPALIGELVQTLLQRGGGGAAVIALIGEKAERTTLGVPPGHVKCGKLFRHGTWSPF